MAAKVGNVAVVSIGPGRAYDGIDLGSLGGKGANGLAKGAFMRASDISKGRASRGGRGLANSLGGSLGIRQNNEAA